MLGQVNMPYIWASNLALNNAFQYIMLLSAFRFKVCLKFVILRILYHVAIFHYIGVTFLGRQRSPHNILTDIVLFAEVEQLADLAGSLGSQTTWNSCVSQARDVTLT